MDGKPEKTSTFNSMVKRLLVDLISRLLGDNKVLSTFSTTNNSIKKQSATADGKSIDKSFLKRVFVEIGVFIGH